MKRQFIKLASVMAMSALLFTACQEEGIAPDENSITAAIEKIETSYVEGDIKELTYDGEKIETRASDSFIKKWIQMQIEEERGSMKRYTNSKLGTTPYDVGVIPSNNSTTNFCPNWSEEIYIYMDCEDHRAATHWGWNGNWKGSWNVTELGGTNPKRGRNVEMRFCRVDGRQFSRIRKDHFAVLKLGTSPPPGAKWAWRVLDNEDHKNDNEYSGNIYPNKQNKYMTKLNFWVFKKNYYSSNYNSFPNLGFAYGVFSNETTHIGDWTGYPYTNKIVIDDEDHHNANAIGWEWGIYPSDFGLFGDNNPNTTITFHRVK